MIVVVAVSYFGSKDLGPYLKSLQAQTFEEWNLVVVDNSEDDDEWHQIESLTDGEIRVKVLRADMNLGYFGAVEWALPQVDHPNVTWLVVSNTDVHLANNDTFAELIRVPMEGIGVLAPSIRSAKDGHDQNPYQLRRPTVTQMRIRKMILGNILLAQIVILVYAVIHRTFKTHNASQHTSAAKFIYAAHGSFFAVSRTFLDRGGNFDFPMFLFAEELYVAEQARGLALKTLYAPSVKVEHFEHRQTGYLRSHKILKCGAQAAHYGYALIKAEKAITAP